MAQAKPALVEASALKPRCCNALALPTSNGLGIGKHPLSCILRNVARLSAVVIAMITPCFLLGRVLSGGDDSHARDLALVRAVNGAAVLRRLRAIVHAVI